ncbi:MAG: hypothetical protein ABIP51_15260 [Bacteroidia bacterium]
MTIENNTITVLAGDVAKQKGDVVLNWTNSSFTIGPPSFYNLMKESGWQPLDSVNTFKANISYGDLKAGDTISTIAGQLNFNLIIHAILPEDTFSLTWRNIIATLKTYKKENVCRNVYITIPDWTSVLENVATFFEYQFLLTDFNYVFIVESEYEKKYLESILSVYCDKENKLLKKVDTFLKKLVVKILNLYRPSVSFKDGHNKKKLQKGS